MKEIKICQRIDAKCPHKISNTKKNCFIIMSYNEQYSIKIEKMLKNAVRTIFELTPQLAKNIKQSGSGDMYCKTVCRPIMESTLCIADFTYNNTNVGFEFGVAQELNKPLIVTRYTPKTVKLSKSEVKELTKIKNKGKIQYSEVPSKIPADISGIFRVEYSTVEELKQKLKDGFKIKK